MWRRLATVMVLGVTLAPACGGVPLRAQQFRGPDGSAGWWNLDCPRSFGDCFQAAGERCPDGWTEQRESERQGFVAGRYSSRSAGIAMSSARSTTERSITVRCTGRSVDPIPACGSEYATHGCQGSSRWVEETLSCEPC